MVLIFIGAAIILIGGFITAFGTYLHNKKSSEKTERIESGVNKNIGIGKTTNEEVKILKYQNNELQKKINELLKVTTAKVVNKPIESILPKVRELKPAFWTNPFFITNTVGTNNVITISGLFSVCP